VTGYLIRRVLQSIVVVFGVVLLTFLLSRLYTKDAAARACLGPKANTQQIQQFNHQYHYDLPIYQQFWIYTKGIVFHGYLGQSCRMNQSVRSLIASKLPKTLVLVGISTIFALLVAIPLGILQVVKRNTPVDYTLTGVSFIGYAMPAFLLGELLILWFAIDRPWFPFEAPQGQTVWQILSDPRALVLPVFSLAVLTIAGFSRYMRSSMMETLTEDYIRTARAKGASPARVLFRHALRNALIPIVSAIGALVPRLLGGTVVTEAVFGWPGMGRLGLEAAQGRDYPLVTGLTVVVAAIAVIASLFVDLAYTRIDPRVRLQ